MTVCIFVKCSDPLTSTSSAVYLSWALWGILCSAVQLCLNWLWAGYREARESWSTRGRWRTGEHNGVGGLHAGRKWLPHFKRRKAASQVLGCERSLMQQGEWIIFNPARLHCICCEMLKDAKIVPIFICGENIQLLIALELGWVLIALCANMCKYLHSSNSKIQFRYVTTFC